MRRHNLWLNLLIVLALNALAEGANLRLASPFGDHMVLQKGVPVTVWGSGAEVEDAVTVRFAGQTKQSTMAPDGTWTVRLDPLAASANGAELSASSGNENVTIRDVLVGEVWLCSGQSNMAAPVREFDTTGDESAKADFPLIRMIRVPERPAESPRRSFDASWQVCAATTAPSFSAFGYHFARKLRSELDNTPVGIVLCAWGGSSVAAWSSPAALNVPEVRSLIPHDVTGWRENCRPSLLYNGMLSPLVPFTFKGVVWYQGETEGDPQQNAFAYRTLFPAMVQDWRKLWKQPDLEFYFVQLPRLIRKPQWPVVREGQAAALSLPRTGMIVTLDLGHDRELHPKNKHQFAERMANLVLARSYGKPIPVDGPVMKSVSPSDGRIRVTFEHADGLKTSDGQPPRCFEVAGADGKYVAARATTEGSSVVVQGDDVRSPMTVRYAFADTPDVNLINGEGLPAVPFRSDALPVPTSELSPQPLPSNGKLKQSWPARVIAKDKPDGWTWAGEGVAESRLEEGRFVRTPEGSSDRVQLVASNRVKSRDEWRSPTLAWQRSIDFKPGSGVTAEIVTQVYRATAPQAGLDLELALVVNGKLLRYRITVAPMRLYGLQDDEIRFLGVDLDNCTSPHAYRISVRPDGIAQVYYDGQLMGTLRATEGPADSAQSSWIRYGKLAPRGELTANVDVVSMDGGDAFAP
jgi:sialate O-acetylesterase